MRASTRSPSTVSGSPRAERGISEKEMRDIEWAKIPMGKPADPAEMASALHFLATDDSSYMTGATLDVNGGCGFY